MPLEIPKTSEPKGKQAQYTPSMDVTRSQSPQSGGEGTRQTQGERLSQSSIDAPNPNVYDLTTRAGWLAITDRTPLSSIETTTRQAQTLQEWRPTYHQIETKFHEYLQHIDKFHHAGMFSQKTLDSLSAETDERISRLQGDPSKEQHLEAYTIHRKNLKTTSECMTQYAKDLFTQRTDVRQHLDQVEGTSKVLEATNTHSQEFREIQNYHRQLSHEYRLVDKELVHLQRIQTSSESMIHSYMHKNHLREESSLRGFEPDEQYGNFVCIPTCITMLENMYRNDKPIEKRFEELHKQFFSGPNVTDGLDLKEAAFVLNKMQLPIQDKQGKMVKFKCIDQPLSKTQLESYLNVRDKQGLPIPVIMGMESEQIEQDDASSHALLIQHSTSGGYNIWDLSQGFHTETLDPIFHAAQTVKFEEELSTNRNKKLIQRTYEYIPSPGEPKKRVILSELSADGKRVPVYEVRDKLDQQQKPIPVIVTDAHQQPLTDFSGQPMQETTIELVVPYF